MICLPTIYINKFQRVQNAAARLGTNNPRICHITPVLNGLHWLSIKYRNEFKIVLLTFKWPSGQAPQYLVDLTAVAAQSRYNLRSRKATLLVPANGQVPTTLLVTEPFSQQLPNYGTAFWWRSETFRVLHLLRELSKRTFLRFLLIDLTFLKIAFNSLILI